MKVTTLKIDYDYKIKNFSKFTENFTKRLIFIHKLYERKLILRSLVIRETKKGYHFYIGILTENKLNDYEICILQLMLLDDFKREGFNLVRVKGGDIKHQKWNKLFIDKEKISKNSIKLEKEIFKSFYLKTDTDEQINECFLKAKKIIKQNPQRIIY